MRANGKAEQRIILTALQTVAPGLLVIRPSRWEVENARDLVIYDRSIAHGGTQYLMIGGKCIDQFLQGRTGYDRLRARNKRVRHQPGLAL
jgi:hypothetical protein